MTAHISRRDQTLGRGFQLGQLRIDPSAGQVQGPGGMEKLDPKVMGVLVVIAEHAGEVVSRDDLLAALWPDAVVTDDALTRCFYELRRHLSRAGGNERYRALVETLPKRGYRLNGTVVPLEPKAGDRPPEPRRQRTAAWAVAAAAAVVLAVIAALLIARRAPAPEAEPAIASTNSIAVLPFLDMSAGKDQSFFSEGVTEEILNRLSQADNLKVIARTSSFSFRDESLDVPEIGKRLNVAYVLEGSVRKAGDRVRITAQLIDVSTNAHVWSHTYDRAVDDLFAIQDEIASSVATALQVTLAGGRAQGRMPERIDAYEQFLQGQYFYNRRSPGNIERSVGYYKEAVALDPRYARAWAALAGAYALLAASGDHPEVPLRELQGEMARKAVELDPDLAVAHARLSQYYFQTGDRAKGDEHYRAAAALDPDDLLVLGFAATRAVWRDDLDEAVTLWRRIVGKDPLSPVNRNNLADLLIANGQLDEALAENRRFLELQPNAEPEASLKIARIYVLQGRYGEAQATLPRLSEGMSRDYVLALLRRAPGRQGESDAALGRMAANARGFRERIYLAEAYAFRGMSDEAFASLATTQDALERDKEQRPYLRNQFQEEIRLSIFLRPLHEDPRWSALMVTAS